MNRTNDPIVDNFIQEAREVAYSLGCITIHEAIELLERQRKENI